MGLWRQSGWHLRACSCGLQLCLLAERATAWREADHKQMKLYFNSILVTSWSKNAKALRRMFYELQDDFFLKKNLNWFLIHLSPGSEWLML